MQRALGISSLHWRGAVMTGQSLKATVSRRMVPSHRDSQSWSTSYLDVGKSSGWPVVLGVLISNTNSSPSMK